MELKHESITLSSLVRRAASPNLLNLNLFFPRRWRRPGSRLSPFPLPPRPGYLKVPSFGALGNFIFKTCFQQKIKWRSEALISPECFTDNVHCSVVFSYRALMMQHKTRKKKTLQYEEMGSDDWITLLKTVSKDKGAFKNWQLFFLLLYLKTLYLRT